MASQSIHGGSTVVRFGSFADPAIDSLNNHFMTAIIDSEKRVVAAEETTTKVVGLFSKEMMSNLADVFEETQKRGEAIVDLKNKQVQVENRHQKELLASHAETEAAKQEIATLKEVLIETAREANEHVQSVIAAQTAAVQATIQSEDVKFAALQEETCALKREVERLRIETDQQHELAIVEKRAAVEAITRQSEATVQAITQDGKAEIEALKQKFQRETAERNRKHQAAIVAAVKAIKLKLGWSL